MSLYKNIQCSEKVTTALGIIDSCYIVVDNVGCTEFSELEAFYSLKVYKDKKTYETDKSKHINISEIQNFTRQFTQDFVSGADLFEKISFEVVNQLCEVNNWNSNNLIIE